MEVFWQTTLSGIVVLIISGLAFIAWYGPDIYRKAVLPLLGVVTVVTMAYFVWSAAFQAGFYDALKLAMGANPGAIINIPSLDGNSPLVAAGVYIGAIVYLTVLWVLADMVARRNNAPKSDGEDEPKP